MHGHPSSFPTLATATRPSINSVTTRSCWHSCDLPILNWLVRPQLSMCDSFRYIDMSDISDNHETALEPIDSPTRRRIQERYSQLSPDDKREILVNTIDQMLGSLEYEEECKKRPKVTTPKSKRKIKITK